MRAILHDERLKTIQRRHPWVFSRAIRRFEGRPQAGDLVSLYSEGGEFLARGFWNPRSQIRLRVLTWQDEAIDEAFWEKRLRAALRRREAYGADEARRLVNAENDYLPSLVVDRYADYAVLQAQSAGIEAHKGLIADLLMRLLPLRGVYERSDGDGREQEGLPPVTGLLAGEAPPPCLAIREGGHRFWVDIPNGQKSGFYLDQRENRAWVGALIPAGGRVLNAFCYTGAFSVYAYAAGAREVLSLDSSQEALKLAEKNLASNGYPTEGLVLGDVFRLLREYYQRGERFDAIILDPPKFAKNAQQVGAALRGYKDINRLAWELLRPEGLLATFSCSGNISADLFRKVVFGALEDSGREAQIIRQVGAAPDHPIALTFPEGEYLKGLLCRVV